MNNTVPVDPETLRLAQRLAEAAGKPVPDIVKEAIAEKAEAAGVKRRLAAKLSRAEKVQRITEISERSAARPVLDRRSPEDIIGYDALGLPR